MFEQTGEIIYVSRKLKGWTQEQLAEHVGVSSAAVSKWERSITIPEIEVLCRLAELFDLSVDELLGRTKGKAAEEENCSAEQMENFELGKRLLEYCKMKKRYGWSAVEATAKKEDGDEFLLLALNLLAIYSSKGVTVQDFKALLNNYIEKETKKERCQLICDALLAIEAGAKEEILCELIASHLGKSFRSKLVKVPTEQERREALLARYRDKEIQVPFLEELAECDDRTIQLILRQLDNETLIAALSGASGKVCKKFLRNVSERMVFFIIVDMEEYGGSIEEVEAAQKQVLESRRK